MPLLVGGCVPSIGRGSTLEVVDSIGPENIALQEGGRAQMLELPAYDKKDHVIEYEGFTVSYNHSTLVPDWVAYELLDSELNGAYNTKSSNFSRDTNLKGRQASREDYSRSGWDRGHMAPKADMRWSSAAYWQSHYFTNICPQNHKLNAGDWNQLERKVRDLAEQYGRVWVVCGPIFTTHQFGTIGEAQVQVPDMFFKALLIKNDNGYSAIAYVMPNKSVDHPLKTYACTVDELEELIGRDLFCQLDDTVEDKVEAEIDWVCWQ